MEHKVDYEPIAKNFDQRYRDYSFAGTRRTIDAIAQRRPGLRALEVGCGTGRWLSLLRDQAAIVSGLDGSANMLQRARERLPGADLRHGSAEHLPWPAASFDLVLCNNALHHFPDKRGFMKEAARVLAPEGELLVIGLDPQKVERWSIYDYFDGTRALDEARYPKGAEVRAWMEEAGFAHTTLKPVDHLVNRDVATEALAGGRLDKHVTSQLSLLSDEDYARGIERIRSESARAEARGETLILESDITLFGAQGVRV
jgi:ubiquinone/menaquinone biosynthesis C-methylase UbiE